MKEIISKLFEQNNFIQKCQSDNIHFFASQENNIVSFFIVNYIDCVNVEKDVNKLREKLNYLENNYIESVGNNKGIKNLIISSFEKFDEVTQIDKNTSAIYLLRFSDINILDKYRKLIYSIEESPIYFKRYILPYSDSQVDELKNLLKDSKKDVLDDCLTDLANNENEYFELLKGDKISAYQLVIRLFSKIPFLKYRFKKYSDTFSLEKMIESKLNSHLKKYDELICKEFNFEDYLLVEEDIEITDKDIKSELDKYMESSK